MANSFAASTFAVHFSSQSSEWLTPSGIISRALDVFGAIDLDPCASIEDPANVPAAQRLTIHDDGLRQRWHGRVYMNPPYGRTIGQWVAKLCDEYRAGRVTAAIALLPARTDTAWWQLVAGYPVCFVRGRLRFSGHRNSAPFPSAIVYLGAITANFVGTFQDLGIVYLPARIDHER